jgi:dolichol-phosphate mannosyltransferase
MNGPLPLVSIVCPAYLEEEGLPIFHEHLVGVLQSLENRFRFEIIYVDDGSSDRTLEVMQSLAARDPRVGFLSLSRNFGQQAALTAGLEHARGDAVISMDADLQHPPEIIPQLLAEWQAGFEVVITIRAEDDRLGWFKRFSSKVFYRLMKWFSDTEIRFAASDFRLLSRQALQGLLELQERHRFVRGLVQWIGFPIKEIGFRPNERCAGVTKYTLRRMLRLAGDGLFSFSRAPLRAPLWAGAVFIGLSLLHALLAVVGLAQGAATPAWHYLLLIMTLGIGSLLFSLGIVGEYLGRIHEQVKGRPIYLLKECRLQPLADALEPSRRDAA